MVKWESRSNYGKSSFPCVFAEMRVFGQVLVSSLAAPYWPLGDDEQQVLCCEFE